MKVSLAYIMVLLGLPLFGGLVFGGLFSLLFVWLCWISEFMRKIYLNSNLELFAGYGTEYSALLLFHYLGVQITIFVPLIMAVELAFYFYIYHSDRISSFIKWFIYNIGIFCGLFFLKRYFN